MTPRFSPNYGWRTFFSVFRPARRNAVVLFEEAFAKKSNQPAAISFAYGRSALFYLLKAIDNPGKEVILPSDTCVVVGHAIVEAGYQPVFLDNAQGARQPSPEDFINAITPKTALVMPTHLYGIPQETQDLVTRVKHINRNIFVLQDCAHSFFCTDSTGHSVTDWGDGALFGMNISKLVNSVKGGVLTLKDESLAARVRALIAQEPQLNSVISRLYVLVSALAFSFPFTVILNFLRRKTRLLDSQTKYYQDDKINLPADFRLRLNSFSAEIGLISLSQYDTRITQRRVLATYYTDTLKRLNSKDIMWYPPSIPGATWSHYPVLVPPAKRDGIIKKLESLLGAEVGLIVDYSVADLPCYQNLGHPSTPRAQRESTQIINLPLTWLETNLCLRRSKHSLQKKIDHALSQTFGENQ